MDDKLLQKLANITLISNNISTMLNRSNIPRATLHKLPAIQQKLDTQFINTIIAYNEEEKQLLKQATTAAPTTTFANSNPDTVIITPTPTTEVILDNNVVTITAPPDKVEVSEVKKEDEKLLKARLKEEKSKISKKTSKKVLRKSDDS